MCRSHSRASASESSSWSFPASRPASATERTHVTDHRTGTQEEWQAARDALLAEEKELTRRSDELARKRRELPWVPVGKDYSFDTVAGTKSLADLFDGRS